MKPRNLLVHRDEHGQKLLDFLASNLHLSKGKAKALVDSRNVLVNSRRVWMARHELCRDDVVQVLVFDSPAPRGPGAAILHEDADYLVVNKPAGVLSNGTNSLEEALRKQRSEPGIAAVHRLDRDTTGCLLLARSREAFDRMLPLFRNHAVSKTYHAIVAGRLETAGRTLTGDIDGLRAMTRIRTLDANREASHIAVRIETGRTHQIRRHLTSIHHPILGDRQYGAGRLARSADALVGRQMLHASEIAFQHPATGERVRVKASLPSDFLRCLRTLKLT